MEDDMEKRMKELKTFTSAVGNKDEKIWEIEGKIIHLVLSDEFATKAEIRRKYPVLSYEIQTYN